MDFNKFDSRKIAEIGAPMDLLDPWTSKPVMSDGQPCRVIVRGTASKTMQSMMRAKQKAAMASHKKGKDDEARVMEDIHDQLCESAAPFIVGFENVMNGDKPATADDAAWFLDLTFPEMGTKQDDEGNDVLDKDGAPTFEMKNNPFAKQVGEFAGKQSNHLGNVKSG